jgi:non-reducing end alpha-L-arabinofuranosidase
MKRCTPVFRSSVILLFMVLLSMAQHKISAAPCPCDIYATGGTPCVAAHSTVRALYSTYNGPLYQVKRTSDNQTKDIGTLTPGGFANAAAVDSFLAGGKAGTVSIIYDQSEQGNHLKSGPAGCYTGGDGSAAKPDKESNATGGGKVIIGGHAVYPLYMIAGDGYRCPTTKSVRAKGVATGNQAEGIYWVVDGKRNNNGCCWDYGNAETNFCGNGTGSMESLYFGTMCWFSPCQGKGPWMLADLEMGLFAGGPSGKDTRNESLNYSYVTGMLKGNTSTYTIRAGNAQSGSLKIMGDGNRPAPNKLEGSIILGVGGDNSNWGYGTFCEGAMTIGRPPDTTEDAVQSNIVFMYGNTSLTYYNAKEASPASPLKVRYNSSSANVIINYALQNTRQVNMNIFDQQGRRIVVIVNGVVPAGLHEAVWDAKRLPAGVYVCRTAIDGLGGWTEKIVIGK